MLKKIVLVFAALALAKAQIPSLGFCPEYIPMADFDMSRFLGVWHEAERYFQFTDVVSRCVTANYTKGPDGKLRVSNEVTNRFTGIKRVLDGEIKPAASKSEEGKLQVKYTTVPLTPETHYYVLHTDYKSYAVLWSCSGFGPIHAQNAWLMTRKRSPSGEILQQAYGILDKYKISKRFFVKTDQTDCVYEAPDISPAPAPAPESAPAPAPVVEPATPNKEPVGSYNSAEKKPAEEVHLRSAALLPEAEAVDETRKEEAAVESADAPPKPIDPVASESVDEPHIANAEPAKVVVPEEPAVDEPAKPQDFQLKAIAPETIPEVILKVAESEKETAAPIAEEPQLIVNPVAEESKTVEVAVPAESQPEIIDAILLPEAAEEGPKIVEVVAKSAEKPEAIEAPAEDLKPETAPIEEPKLAEPEIKLAEEAKPVEIPLASEPAEESKPLEPLAAVKSQEVPEIAKPLEESEKIESPAPAVLVEAVAPKSAEVIVPVVPAEEIKVAEIPAVPESAPGDSLVKTLEVPEAEHAEIILEPVVAETPVVAAQPLKSVEVAAEESKVEVIDEVPKTLDAKP